MGRGSTTIDSSSDILYGNVQPRRAVSPGTVQIGEETDIGRVVTAFEVLPDAIRYFDQSNELCLVEVTGPEGYTLPNFAEQRRILIGQQEPLLEDISYTDIGTKLYIAGGRLHRLAGPAFERPDGAWAWFYRGYEHREADASAPAARTPDGSLHWYKYGMRHRFGQPAIEYADGARFYYRYGKMHRQDGPAMISADGTGNWYLYGQRHREDGPAAPPNKYYLYGQACKDERDHKLQKRHHDARKKAKEWVRYWVRYCEQQEGRTWKQRLLEARYEIVG